LKPGLNELVFHLAFNGDEMRAVAAGEINYGATWCQQTMIMPPAMNLNPS